MKCHFLLHVCTCNFAKINKYDHNVLLSFVPFLFLWLSVLHTLLPPHLPPEPIKAVHHRSLCSHAVLGHTHTHTHTHTSEVTHHRPLSPFCFLTSSYLVDVVPWHNSHSSSKPLLLLRGVDTVTSSSVVHLVSDVGPSEPRSGGHFYT